MSKHTPKPWEIVSKFVGPLVIKSGNTEIAYVGADTFELCKANAEHIIKCVNLHDEMVKALSNATSMASCIIGLSNHDSKQLFDALKVLEKARGGDNE